jgi:hypothetical protein
MACTLPLFENGNLPANCHHYAGTNRVCGCKGRSWSVTGALAEGIREVATVATPANLPRWLGVWAYRGCPGEPGHRLDESMAHTILRRNYLEPAPPQHTMGISRGQFLKLHWGALATTDLGPAEVATR